MVSGEVNPTLSFIISAYLGMEGLWEGLLYSDGIKHQGPLVGLVDHQFRKMILKPPSPKVGACCDEQMNSWDGKLAPT